MLRHSTGYHLTISPYYKFKTISPFPTRHPILFQLKFPQISRKARGAWPKFLHRFRNENDRLKDPRRVRERARLCRRGFDTSVGGEPSTKTWPVVPRPHLDKLARSLAIPLPTRTKAHAREWLWKITVAKWNELVVDVP